MNKLPVIISAGLAVFGALLCFGAPKALAEDAQACMTCHGNPGFSKTDSTGRVISLYVAKDLMNTSAHRYIDCVTCHGDSPHNSGSPLTKLSLAEKCGQCHQYEFKLHTDSVHGQQLKEGNTDVATCVDCHSNTQNPHSVVRVLEYNAPAFKKNISETCGRCHNDPNLMANYGIVEKVYESYMRSFHGKAMKLGTYEINQIDKATCTNCHGVHDIKSSTDPSSPVAGLENLSATCEQCHKGAGVEFAKGFLGHKAASPDNVPPVFFAEKFFSGLLVTVLSVGAVIVVSSGIRYGINRWRE
jgi:nitrate/TMAO reductase-like tetraheme cytochrome c subunit